jgi:hypothetical protein
LISINKTIRNQEELLICPLLVESFRNIIIALVMSFHGVTCHLVKLKLKKNTQPKLDPKTILFVEECKENLSRSLEALVLKRECLLATEGVAIQ